MINFRQKIYFKIRRSNKFWPDAIEQMLMRMMRNRSGFTRGCGISDRLQSSLVMIFSHNVCHTIETYCNDHRDTSEPYTDARTSRTNRDNENFKNLLHWFVQHSCFSEIDSCHSIITEGVEHEN